MKEKFYSKNHCFQIDYYMYVCILKDPCLNTKNHWYSNFREFYFFKFNFTIFVSHRFQSTSPLSSVSQFSFLSLAVLVVPAVQYEEQDKLINGRKLKRVEAAANTRAIHLSTHSPPPYFSQVLVRALSRNVKRHCCCAVNFDDICCALSREDSAEQPGSTKWAKTFF